MFYARSKHIKLDYHFVREKVTMENIITRHISSASQPANIFTKPLSKAAFHTFRGKLGVHSNFHASLRGHVKGYNPSDHASNKKHDEIVQIISQSQQSSDCPQPYLELSS